MECFLLSRLVGHRFLLLELCILSSSLVIVWQKWLTSHSVDLGGTKVSPLSSQKGLELRDD